MRKSAWLHEESELYKESIFFSNPNLRCNDSREKKIRSTFLTGPSDRTILSFRVLRITEKKTTKTFMRYYSSYISTHRDILNGEVAQGITNELPKGNIIHKSFSYFDG